MDKETRIKEIDEELKELKQRKNEWKDNKSIGIPMSLIIDHDIDKLLLEKGDLENGTHNYRIYQLEKEIDMLKMLRAQAVLLGKLTYSIKIKNAEKELDLYKNKRK